MASYASVAQGTSSPSGPGMASGISTSGTATQTAADIAIGGAAKTAQAAAYGAIGTVGRCRQILCWAFDTLKLYMNRFPPLKGFVILFSALGSIPLLIFLVVTAFTFGTMATIAATIIGFVQSGLLAVGGTILGFVLLTAAGFSLVTVGGVTIAWTGLKITGYTLRQFQWLFGTSAQPYSRYQYGPSSQYGVGGYGTGGSYTRTGAVASSVEEMRRKGEEVRQNVSEILTTGTGSGSGTTSGMGATYTTSGTMSGSGPYGQPYGTTSGTSATSPN